MKNRVVLTALVVLALAACGGSSGDGSAPDVLPVTTSHVLAFGPITGFGSVLVNGVRFETAAASVTLDDEHGTVADLRAGMVVSIGGTIDTRTRAANASEITFVDDAEGPVSSINFQAQSFVVLGRTVSVDELTAFESITFQDLEVGHVVEVSGLWRSQERIQATYLRRVANRYVDGTTMEVKGKISGLDIGRQRFRIGAQYCDYSAAMLELGGADLADGVYVAVSGTTAIAGGDMMLNRVQVRDRDRDRRRLCAGDCDFELVGYVTSYVSATEFEVDGQPVTTSEYTVYVNGTINTLALDVKVSIDGTLDEAGALAADRIVFHLPSLVEIEADVAGLSSGSETVTVLGIDVRTNEFTLFRDLTTSGPQDFGLDDLAVGDRVEIRAVLDGDAVVASRLERDDADEGVTLKAPVESVDRPGITLLGVTLTSDENTTFQNASHVEVDADTFFGLVEPGSLVRAEGIYDGAAIRASKMFLRECVNGCL